MKNLIYDYENNTAISSDIDMAVIHFLGELMSIGMKHSVDIIELAEVACADAIHSHLRAAEGMHDLVLAGKQASEASLKRLKDDYGINIDTDKLNKIFNS